MRIEEFVNTPKTLFVKRDLLNTNDIRAWAKEQGFKSTLADGDMHVTIAFSSEPFDWDHKFNPKENRLTIKGGKRTMEQFGDAVVLCFDSNKLQERWQEFDDGGASYDFPKYRPHITITYEDMNLDDVEPYDGDLVLGPEVFKEINDDWADDIEEDEL